MADHPANERIILLSTMQVRREFRTDEYRLDVRASYPRDAPPPLERLLARIAALGGKLTVATERLWECEETCEELVELAEAGNTLSCHCECSTETGGSQFMLICHTVD
jgi:hypothetical protein